MAGPTIDDSTIDKFLCELEELYRKYGLSLSHEDSQGAFIIEKLDVDNIKWVKAARRRARYQ